LAVHLDRRFFYIPGNVKLFESPGKAGGLPMDLQGESREIIKAGNLKKFYVKK
jgi:hypothetical protein